MNKILSLYRVTRKCAQTEEDTKISNIIAYAILGVVMVALLGAGGYYSGVLAPLIASLVPGTNVTVSLFTLIFWFSGISILFTAFKKLLGTMFMSSDVDILAAMPLSSSQIAITRVLPVLPFSYATTACVILPFTIGYTLSAGFDAVLLAAAFLGIVIIPAGVISIVAILLTLVMKVFRQVRNRDMLTVLGAIAGGVLILAVNVFSHSISNASISGSDQVAELMSTLSSVSSIAWSLPFTACLGQALTDGPLYLLAAIAIVAALLAIMYAVLSRLYLSAALSMANARSSSKALDDEKLERGSASRSVDRALFLKEAKSYFKESNFMQGWIFAPLLPLIFLATSVMSADGDSTPGGFIGATVELGQYPVAYSILLGVFVALSTIALAAAVSTAGTSCISREGEGFDFMKTCPVEYRVQINAKRKVAMIPLALAAVVFEVVVFVIAALYGTVSIAMLASALITDVFAVVLFTNLQIRTAARKANLHWSNSQTAIKNMGLWVIIGLVLYAIFTVLTVLTGLAAELFEAMNATLWVYIGTGFFVVLLALAAFLTTKPALRYAAEKIEELS